MPHLRIKHTNNSVPTQLNQYELGIAQDNLYFGSSDNKPIKLLDTRLTVGEGLKFDKDNNHIKLLVDNNEIYIDENGIAHKEHHIDEPFVESELLTSGTHLITAENEFNIYGHRVGIKKHDYVYNPWPLQITQRPKWGGVGQIYGYDTTTQEVDIELPYWEQIYDYNTDKRDATVGTRIYFLNQKKIAKGDTIAWEAFFNEAPGGIGSVYDVARTQGIILNTELATNGYSGRMYTLICCDGAAQTYRMFIRFTPDYFQFHVIDSTVRLNKLWVKRNIKISTIRVRK